MVTLPPLLVMLMSAGGLVNVRVTFPPPVSMVAFGEVRLLPSTSPPPVVNFRTPPRWLRFRLPPPESTVAALPVPDSATLPPPLVSVTVFWMPLIRRLPPPLFRSSAVRDGTLSVAFSPQLPVKRRQWRLNPVPSDVKSGRIRLYCTVPVSRAEPALAGPWLTVRSLPLALATRRPW